MNSKFVSVVTINRNYKAPIENDEGSDNIKPNPVPHVNGVADKHWTGSDLMHKAESDCQIGIEMNCPPSLILHLDANLLIRSDSGNQEEDKSNCCGEHPVICPGEMPKLASNSRSIISSIGKRDKENVEPDQKKCVWP